MSAQAKHTPTSATSTTTAASTSAVIRPKSRVTPEETSQNTDLPLNNKNHPVDALHSQKARASGSSTRSDSIRRIQREWRDIVEAGMGYHWKLGRPLRPIKPSHLWLGPIDRNLLIWHFTLVGLPHTAFSGGLYHGAIYLPRTYPAQPPRVQVWTPSGRFIPHYDVCLSASQYHPESWNPSQWTVRTLVESLRLHFATQANEIGGLNKSFQERLELARESLHYKVRFAISERETILVDHETMIRQGLFEGLLIEVEDEPGSVEAPSTLSTPTHPVKRKKRRRRKRKSSSSVAIWSESLHRMLRNPVKVVLWSLLLLICILNRP